MECRIRVLSSLLGLTALIILTFSVIPVFSNLTGTKKKEGIKMKKLSMAILLVLLGFSSSFGKIIEDHPNPNISVLDYVIASSTNEGQIVTKAMQLKVKNLSNSTLHDLKFSVRSARNISIIDGEVFLGNINPGEIMISNDTFKYSIDTSKVNNDLVIMWSVEYNDAEGKHWINEDIVVEKQE